MKNTILFILVALTPAICLAQGSAVGNVVKGVAKTTGKELSATSKAVSGVAGAERIAQRMITQPQYKRWSTTPRTTTVLTQLKASQFVEIQPSIGQRILQKVNMAQPSPTLDLLRPAAGEPARVSYNAVYGKNPTVSMRSNSKQGVIMHIWKADPNSADSMERMFAKLTPFQRMIQMADYAVLGVGITAQESTFLSHLYAFTLRRIAKDPASVYASLDSWGEIMSLVSVDSFFGAPEDAASSLAIVKSAPAEYVLLTDFVFTRAMLNMGPEAYKYIEELAAFRATQGWPSRPVFEEIQAYAEQNNLMFNWPEPIEGKVSAFVPDEQADKMVYKLFHSGGIMDKLMRHWYPLEDLENFLKLKNNINIIIE